MHKAKQMAFVAQACKTASFQRPPSFPSLPSRAHHNKKRPATASLFRFSSPRGLFGEVEFIANEFNECAICELNDAVAIGIVHVNDYTLDTSGDILHLMHRCATITAASVEGFNEFV
jgi:hypothetical protein